jgi:hypothetical protein
VLYVVNRPGNAPSHAGAAQWIDKAIDLVAPYAPRVCLRGDTDFSLTAHFDRWAQRVEFIFGMDSNAALRQRAEALDESDWKPLRRKPRYRTRTAKRRTRRVNHKRRIVAERGFLDLRLNHEHVAEFDYRPGKCARAYRVVAVRKNISRARGEQVLFDEIRYFFYITTRTDLTAEQLLACANERCDQENVVGQLKSGVNALRVPLYDLVSNWAYMVIATLAWNIKSWFAMMMHRKADRRDYIRMEFRRFLTSIVLIPSMITAGRVGSPSGSSATAAAWTDSSPPGAPSNAPDSANHHRSRPSTPATSTTEQPTTITPAPTPHTPHSQHTRRPPTRSNQRSPRPHPKPLKPTTPRNRHDHRGNRLPTRPTRLFEG